MERIKTDLIYADLTFQIRRALFNVYNGLGFGHKEQVYQKALAKEFMELNILHEREKSLKVQYKKSTIGLYRPDFIIDNKVILEIKAVEFMPKSFEMQLIHYLKSTNYKVGILANFGSSRIYIKRLVWTNNLRKSAHDPRRSF